MKATLLTLVAIATAAFSVPALADPVVVEQRYDDHYRNDRDYHEYSRHRDWEYYHHRHHHHRPAVSIELGR